MKKLIFFLLLPVLSMAQPSAINIRTQTANPGGGSSVNVIIAIGTDVDTLKSPGDSMLPITYSGNSAIGWIKYTALMGGGGGSGTVTSVGLALPGEFNVSNSPVTNSGTLTGAWANQSAFTVFGRASGTGVPSFQALDTTYISNFYVKVRALLSANPPLSYNSSTGVFSADTSGAQGFATQYGLGRRLLATDTSGQVLTASNTKTVINKTMSGNTNTFTDIPNSALTNSSINVNGRSFPLGTIDTIGADLSFYRYTAGRWYSASVTFAANTTTNFALNVIRWVGPFIIGINDTIKDIGINISVGGSAGCFFNMGIYDATPATQVNAHSPRNRLWQSGALAGDVTGDVTATPNLIVEPGVYWLAFNNNSATGITTRSIACSAGPVTITGESSLSAAQGPVTYTSASTHTGAAYVLPSTSGSWTASTSSVQHPQVKIRF